MDATGDCFVDFADFAVFAEQWLTEGIPSEPGVMVWVSISEPNFTGEMSKYETTNAQYCQFLNAALASGDINVSGNDAIGAVGSNGGADYAGELYYDGDGAGVSVNGANNGGAARIHYISGVFTVDPNFENHPVTQVTWYGSAAFCNYYGYRLPTQAEWRAVADFNDSYLYGCGITINNSIANYWNSAHLDGTAIVGAFGTYGYGVCDMAGNAFEWTSSTYIDDYGTYRIMCGGNWASLDYNCAVSAWSYGVPGSTNASRGFRVCR